MTEFFDVDTPRGQFHALLLLYCGTLALRCLGFQWVENDNTMLLGAILTLLRSYMGEKK